VGRGRHNRHRAQRRSRRWQGHCLRTDAHDPPCSSRDGRGTLLSRAQRQPRDDASRHQPVRQRRKRYARPAAGGGDALRSVYSDHRTCVRAHAVHAVRSGETVQREPGRIRFPGHLDHCTSGRARLNEVAPDDQLRARAAGRVLPPPPPARRGGRHVRGRRDDALREQGVDRPRHQPVDNSGLGRVPPPRRSGLLSGARAHRRPRAPARMHRFNARAAERRRIQQHADGQRVWMRMDAHGSGPSRLLEVRAGGRRRSAEGRRPRRAVGHLSDVLLLG